MSAEVAEVRKLRNLHLNCKLKKRKLQVKFEIGNQIYESNGQQGELNVDNVNVCDVSSLHTSLEFAIDMGTPWLLLKFILQIPLVMWVTIFCY